MQLIMLLSIKNSFSLIFTNTKNAGLFLMENNYGFVVMQIVQTSIFHSLDKSAFLTLKAFEELSETHFFFSIQSTPEELKTSEGKLL